MKMYKYCLLLLLLQPDLQATEEITLEPTRDFFSWFGGGEIVQFLSSNENSVKEQIIHFLENRIYLISAVNLYMEHKDALHNLLGQKSPDIQINKKSEQLATKGFIDLASFYLSNRETIQRAVKYFAQDKEKIESALQFFKQHGQELVQLLQEDLTKKQEYKSIVEEKTNTSYKITSDLQTRSFNEIVTLFSENQSEIESGVKFFEERENEMVAAVNFFYENKEALVQRFTK